MFDSEDVALEWAKVSLGGGMFIATRRARGLVVWNIKQPMRDIRAAKGAR